MAYSDDSGVFGVEGSGWVEQHRSRDVYEMVREPIQNAMDTRSDLYVRVDYGDRSVTVEDYGDGVDFELAYISKDTEDGQTQAIDIPGDETVYLNAFANDWNEPTLRRMGRFSMGSATTRPTWMRTGTVRTGTMPSKNWPATSSRTNRRN